MKLEIKHNGLTTSLYDGKLEVCKLMTGSRQINLRYAKAIIEALNKDSK